MFGGKRLMTRADRFFSAMIGVYQDNDIAQQHLSKEGMDLVDDARRNVVSVDIVANFELDSASAKEFLFQVPDGKIYCLSSIGGVGQFTGLSPSMQIELVDKTQPPAFFNGDPDSSRDGSAPIRPLLGNILTYLPEPFDFMRIIPGGAFVRVTMRRHPDDIARRSVSIVFTAWEIARSW